MKPLQPLPLPIAVAIAAALLTSAAAITVCVPGCGETGQTEVAYPTVAHGVAPAPFAAPGGWTVTLQVAQVGFGPVYFCSTRSASSDLCPAAQAELAEVATIDALDPAPQPLGDVHGVSGVINSTTYDFAVTWLATQATISPSSAAPGGHAAHFEGTAVKDTTTLHFVADVDAVPLYRGTRAVQGQRVSADVQDSSVELDVAVDPTQWWNHVDFDELVALGGDPVIVPRSSRAHSSVALQMTNNAPVTFVWSASTP